MKSVTRLISLLLVLGLAACGSADHPSTATSEQAKSTPTGTSTDKTPGKTDSATKTATTPAAGSGNKGSNPSKPTTNGQGTPAQPKASLGLPNYSAYQIGPRSAFPVAGVVAAGARFQLIFTSKDGRAHLVKVRTPAPRTINVQGRSQTRIMFQAVRPGNYLLDVDGTRAVATLAVMDPKKFGKTP